MSFNRIAPLALAIAASLAIAPAWAQGPQPQPQPESSADANAAADTDADAQESTAEQAVEAERARELGAVTVTARRREESLQNVPVAVSAFDADELRNLQAQQIIDLQGAVPNLNIVQGRGSANSTNVFIRGIGQPDALQSFDPGVGVYVDDVYLSRINGTLFTLFDVERVEVLRGPQGTLYGKNSTGGAIRLVSRAPGQEQEGAIELAIGDYGRFDSRFYANQPLTETFAVSLAGALINSDGYVTEPVTGQDYNEDDNSALRMRMGWTPNDDFSAIVSFDYSHQDNALTLGNPEATLFQTDLARGLVALRPASGSDYDFETRTSFAPGDDQKLMHNGVSAVLDWQMSEQWALKSISAYRTLNTRSYVDIDASEFELGDVLVALDQNQTSQEFQFLYDNGSNLNGVFGLYYLKEDVPSHQEAYADSFLAFNGAPISFLRTVDDDLETTSYAAFADLSWEFAESWTLSGGARYTRDEKDYFRTTSTFSNLAALRGTFAFTESDSWSKTTPSISLSKAFGENATGYLSANEGFKSGGFNGRANSATEVSSFDPETVWTYELGFKATTADRRLAGNFAVFYSEYEDFQARVSEVQNPGAPIPTFAFPVLNAAKLGIAGAEFEGIMLIGDATQVSTQIGWLDADYDEFDDPRVDLNPALAGLHEHVAFAPDWTARIAAQHSFFLGNGGVITVGGDASYRDDTWLSVDNRDVLKQDAFTLVGLFGVYDTPGGTWQLRAGVRNLTDELYKTDAQEFSSVGNIQTAYYGMPRNYYVSARWNF